MRRFIKNIAISILFFVAFLGFISCETDFENIESGVLENNLTTTNEVTLDVEINPIDLDGVRADNIDFLELRQRNNINISPDYWLGNYTQNEYSKSIKAGFVSQLNLPATNLVTVSAQDPTSIIFFLDKVVLKIPYKATPTGAVGTNGETLFSLDSILKTNSATDSTKIKVYQNPFFLNNLNPEDPSKQNSFKSNFNYFLNNDRNLLSEEGFKYAPNATDTKYFFERINRENDINSTTFFTDSIVLSPRQVDGTPSEATAPFLAIPLNLDKMQNLFWDKFNDDEFASNTAFQDYFKGLIVVPEDNNGTLVPFNLNNSNAQLSFIFSIVDATSTDLGFTYREYNFPLGNIINSTYDMTPAQQETTTDNFIIQGTDGSNAEINILGVNLSALPTEHPFLKYADKDTDGDGYLGLDDLKELKDENGNPLIVINDASLAFYVNQSINSDATSTPQQLHLYKDTDFDGIKTPTNITDAYQSFTTFGGNLNLSSDEKTPDNYTFKITDFISDFIDETNKNDETKLILKVFNNTTDNPVINPNPFTIRFNVEDYNWNPRSVALFNQKTADETKKAQIKVVYTELNN